jgi:hypothetical protein
MSIKWTGGSPEAAINQVVFPQVRDNVAARLREVRCPVHGSTPKSVTVTGRDMASLGWHISGCCDKLTEAVKDAFR